VLGELARAEATLLKSMPGPTRRLRIGTDVPVALGWLPDAVAHTRSRLPSVSVELGVDGGEGSIDALIDGLVDLAVVHGHEPDPRFHITSLFAEELIGVVVETHRLARKEFAEPGDLEIELVVTHPAAPAERRPISLLLSEAGLRPKRVIHQGLTEAIIGIAKTERAVAIIPRWALERICISGDLRAVKLTATGVFRSWQAVTRATGAPTVHAQAFAAVVDTMMNVECRWPNGQSGQTAGSILAGRVARAAALPPARNSDGDKPVAARKARWR
jgi:DNA-binding transcriptional LysR family regulator